MVYIALGTLYLYSILILSSVVIIIIIALTIIIVGSCLVVKKKQSMILSQVDQQTITDNPAYDEGNYVHIITLYSSYYDHYIVHRLEMRSRRVELETNPSYITVQPSRTCTADYENIII